MPSPSQVVLSLTVLLAALSSYLVMIPPNPSPSPSSSTPSRDLLREWGLGRPNASAVLFSPVLLLAVYHALLALFYPRIPSYLLRHGKANGLNAKLITWSPATVIPLAAILLVAVPLRAASYVALGSNFTYTLTEPNGLMKEGVYQWVQHPGYSSFVVLLGGLGSLFFRADGVLSCLVGRGWYGVVRNEMKWVVAPVAIGVVGYAVRGRVLQEEEMLEGLFGSVWREWAGRTARFVPGIF